MKIINPVNEEIKVQIKSHVYILPALGTLENVPKEHAEYWKNRLHNFLILEQDGETPKQKEEKESSEEKEQEESKEELEDSKEEVLEVKKPKRGRKAK